MKEEVDLSRQKVEEARRELAELLRVNKAVGLKIDSQDKCTGLINSRRR